MQTASGVAFDLVRPTPDMVRLGDVAHHLAQLCRFTGATSRPSKAYMGPRRVPCHYSVAQHSWLCAEWMADHGRPEWGLRALLHDVEEAYTGDRSSPMAAACAEVQFEYPALAPDPFTTIKHRVRAVCWEALGLGKPSDAELVAVKTADSVLLATERRDLLVPCDRPWDHDGKIEPWARRIESGHDAWAAKEIFLDRFARFARLAGVRP